MNSIDKAVQVIYDEVNQTWERGEILTTAGEAERLANALADAGLLAPDLPTPTKIEDDECCWDKTHTHLAYDYQTGAEKKIKVPGGVTVIQDEDAEVWLDVDYGIHSLALDEARSLGLVLLAAANYSEEA
jgi:hypothetical protein